MPIQKPFGWLFFVKVEAYVMPVLFSRKTLKQITLAREVSWLI
jgi:hypothetical protein